MLYAFNRSPRDLCDTTVHVYCRCYVQVQSIVTVLSLLSKSALLLIYTAVYATVRLLLH
jgi:hypothetical protein